MAGPLIGLVVACLVLRTTAPPALEEHRKYQLAFRQAGVASWYSVKTNGGTRTASMRPLRDGEFTAAHRSLPFGSKVVVTHMGTRKKVVVTITDRGPYIRGRIIDVSVAAAKQLGFHRHGLAKVRIRRVR